SRDVSTTARPRAVNISASPPSSGSRATLPNSKAKSSKHISLRPPHFLASRATPPSNSKARAFKHPSHEPPLPNSKAKSSKHFCSPLPVSLAHEPPPPNSKAREETPLAALLILSSRATTAQQQGQEQ
ncbi:hypothetical protein AVEN_97502-1, partial [Araneus ventricosus]